MLLLTNIVSGRRLFHKQSPEFCIECHTATILDGCTGFLGRVSSNTIRRDSPGTYANPMSDLTTAFAVPNIEGNARAENVSKHSAVSRGVIRRMWL